VLFKKHEAKRTPRNKRGCEDNIKMGLRETGCEDVDWIHLAQDRIQRRALVDV
jgi:hypothetical protein